MSEPPRKRRWFQFSVVSLLTITCLSATALRWFTRPEIVERLHEGNVTSQAQVRRNGDRQTYVGWWGMRNASGNVIARGNYHNGKPHGKWTTWDAHGRKLVEGEYRNGKLHGVWIEWHSSGKKVREVHYEHGKMVSTQ